MQKLFLKILIFLVINALIAFAFLCYIHFQDSELTAPYGKSESVLITMPSDTEFNILVMGSSHGRMFSRGPLHDSLEAILNVKACNISKWSAGVVPERMFLKHFYKKGNKAETVFYIIDPFAIYSPDWNENLYVLNDEPFRFDFALNVLLSPLNGDVSFNYIKSKFTEEWKKNHANSLPDITGRLDSVDHEAVKKQITAWFRSGVKQENLDKYFDVFKQIISDLKENGVKKIVVIVPPSLLGHFDGIDQLTLKMKFFVNDKTIIYKELNDIYNDPHLFYDHTHLNISGSVKFMREEMKLLL